MTIEEDVDPSATLSEALLYYLCFVFLEEKNSQQE